MKSRIVTGRWLLCAIACITVFLNVPAAHAQIEVSQDFFPYQNLSSPGAGLNNAQIQSKATSVKLGFPLIYSEGKTILLNQLYYRRRDFSYKGFSGAAPNISDIHDLNYTFMLIHSFSERWSMQAFVIPGFASDFEASLSFDDFNFQAVTAFTRNYSPRFSLGFGAVYSTQFGQPIPFPVFAINWNNGSKVSWNTILPVSSEFRYAATSKLDLGLTFGLDGNNYHGDPSLLGVADPQLRYFILTLGPTAVFKPSNLFHIKLDAGIIGVQKFRLFNGNTQQASFDLKPSPFFRLGFAIGGYHRP